MTFNNNNNNDSNDNDNDKNKNKNNSSSDTNPTPIEDTISDETSKRICTHMNEDHAISVFGMANATPFVQQQKKKNVKLTHATLTKVTRNESIIQIVLCSGDTCEQHSITFPLLNLKHSKQIRSELIKIHNTVLQPQYIVPFQSIQCIVSGVLVGILAYCTFILGRDGMRTILEPYIITVPDDETTTIRTVLLNGCIVYVPKLFWLLVILHFIEADIVVYYARTQWKLSIHSCWLWFFTVFVFGITATKSFFQFYRHHEHKKEKKEL